MLHANNRTVNVNRGELIAALKEGRTKHLTEYLAAKKDYQEAAVKFLSEACERAKQGDLTNIVFKLPKPESHADDYNEIIAMMERSVDNAIPLDSQSFKAYFLGEWGWRRDFLSATASLSGYLGKA